MPMMQECEDHRNKNVTKRNRSGEDKISNDSSIAKLSGSKSNKRDEYFTRIMGEMGEDRQPRPPNYNVTDYPPSE